MAIKASDFDHPIVFLFVLTIGVIAMQAFLAWGFATLGWTGPLGLVKGGVAPQAPGGVQAP
jgi:hypothetical protein